jgi:predicted transcriptional regulator
MKEARMISAMRKAKPKNTDTIVRSVILPKDVDAKLLAIAARDERPLTWVIARAVKEFIDRDEKRSR